MSPGRTGRRMGVTSLGGLRRVGGCPEWVLGTGSINSEDDAGLARLVRPEVSWALALYNLSGRDGWISNRPEP